MKQQKIVFPGLIIRVIFITLLLFFNVPVSLHAQTYPYYEYTINDGLQVSNMLTIFQDSRGYIWITTRNGLARFNGSSFINYLRKDGLPSNMVSKVVEDRANTIWAVTANGIARFNGKTFKSYPIPDTLGIKQMTMGCEAGDTATFFLYGAVNMYQNRILLFSNGCYSDFSARHPVLRDQFFIPAYFNAEDSALYMIGKDNIVYSFRNDTITLVDNGPATKVTVADGKVVTINENAEASKNTDSLIWEGPKINLTLKDREGTIWCCTENNLFRLISRAFIEYDSEDGLPENSWAIVADTSGGLWIGSQNGVLKYFDGSHFRENKEFIHLYGNTPPVFYRGSTTLSNGDIWFSTNKGILIMSRGKFRRLKLDNSDLQVCIIYEDPVNKNVLVGTDKGLYIVEGNNVKHYPQISWAGYGIAEGIVRDHAGNYWISGHNGLVFFNGKDFVPFRSAPAPVEMVWGVICDYMGNIWSAGSDGLFFCNPGSPEFIEALPEEINLPANVIRDMGNRKLLVGRMLDICIIDLDKYYKGVPDYYTIIDCHRGFIGNDCQDNGIVRDANGTWWILTSEKMIRFDPDLIIPDKYPPENYLTEVYLPNGTLGHGTVLDSSLFYNTTNKIIIHGRRNDLRISYTGISTANPEDITYRYRLKGMNDDWSAVTRKRFAIYTDLLPGDYTFELSAINADGVISDSPARLEITVVPSFFQLSIVRVLLVIIALTIIVIISLQAKKSVQERRIATARKQAESYKLQLNSIIKQFDPHFTFNAVSSVGSLIMKGEKETAYNYFIKLSNLLRSIISDSTILMKPLEKELEFVTRYCELQKLRFGNRFQYSINVSPDINLKTPVPKMSIQSFVENSVKHGIENKQGIGTLEVNIEDLENSIVITVRDNGIGRAAANELHTDGAGTGLKNINSIVQTMNKVNKEKIVFELEDLIENGKPAGTIVKVFLPKQYSVDFPSHE